MNLAGHKLGPERPPLIVAEIGLSHGGDGACAEEFVERAYACGAGAVKLQVHGPLDEEMTPDHPWRERIAQCMLSHEDLLCTKAEAERLGLLWFASPFTVTACKWLVEQAKAPVVKVGSGEVTYKPMIDYLASVDVPVIVSNGLCHPDELRAVVNSLGEQRAVLMGCVSEYPTPLDRLYPEPPPITVYLENNAWGWSDHTGGIAAPLAAVTNGASIVEVHVPDTGPDAEASLSWEEFEILCDLAPRVRQACLPPKEPVPRNYELERIARHDFDAGWRRSVKDPPGPPSPPGGGPSEQWRRNQVA